MKRFQQSIYKTTRNEDVLDFLKSNSIDLYLNYCGHEFCEPKHFYGPAKRTEYLIHYIVDGKGTFICDKKTYKLGKHDAFLIMPEEITYYEADEEEPWEYVWIGFNGLKALQIIENAGFSKENRINHFPDPKPIIDNISLMLKAHKMTYANDLIRQGQLYLVLASMTEQYQRLHPTTEQNKYTKQNYVEYAVRFIEQNYHKNIKVSDIANYIGINRSYFTKIFKQEMGLSPQQYLLHFKMHNAASLLEDTDLAIKVISKRNGYDNSLTFSKAFKSFFGISPKKYRLKAQGE